MAGSVMLFAKPEYVQCVLRRITQVMMGFRRRFTAFLTRFAGQATQTHGPSDPLPGQSALWIALILTAVLFTRNVTMLAFVPRRLPHTFNPEAWFQRVSLAVVGVTTWSAKGVSPPFLLWCKGVEWQLLPTSSAYLHQPHCSGVES